MPGDTRMALTERADRTNYC